MSLTKSVLKFFSIAILVLIVSCSGTTEKAPDPTPLPDGITLTDDIRKIGYTFLGTDIVFIFDESVRGVSSPSSVTIKASFNSWNAVSWPLNPSTISGVWYLVKPIDSVSVPGNSGHPEFGYMAGGTWKNPPASTPAGYKFNTNCLVIFPTATAAEITEIITNESNSSNLKILTDFDLDTEQGKKDISNFRGVAGSAKLFRSYHPYIPEPDASKRGTGTEVQRIAIVKAYMESTAIKSVVCLSGNESSGSISAYHQAIITGGHVLWATTDYNTVYFASNGSSFGNLINSIVTFINNTNNEAPFLVHCRLGTDRTGVVCAVLAALTGTSWNDIKTDYQKSNNMGINEFRDSGILKYSFKQMLGADPADSTNLKADLSAYFINHGYLSAEQIADLNTKLN